MKKENSVAVDRKVVMLIPFDRVIDFVSPGLTVVAGRFVVDVEDWKCLRGFQYPWSNSKAACFAGRCDGCDIEDQ